jgi:peptide-methionine (R)-S-oxide reductase
MLAGKRSERAVKKSKRVRAKKTLQVFILISCVVFAQPIAQAEEAVCDSQKTDAQWKAELTPEQYKIMREKGTEPAFSGKLVHNKADGFYRCAACGSALFNSEAKFDSGTGWPSFDSPLNTEKVFLQEDLSHGMKRIEVLCKNCGGHLGHVFDDNRTDTGQRFCINSASLEFTPDA